MKELPKDVFISSIESIRLQTNKDITNADVIGQVFNTDAVSAYDNGLLVKAVIALLQVHFPKTKNGFCEIEHYCFDMNFGKVGDQEVITPEDLWYQLVKGINELPELYSKENQDRVLKELLLATTNPIFEDTIAYYDLIQDARYVVEVKSIAELLLLMPDYGDAGMVKEFFEIDKNHKEYIGFGSSITKGWKPLFIHPEGKVVVPFDKVKNIPSMCFK